MVHPLHPPPVKADEDVEVAEDADDDWDAEFLKRGACKEPLFGFESLSPCCSNMKKNFSDKNDGKFCHFDVLW